MMDKALYVLGIVGSQFGFHCSPLSDRGTSTHSQIWSRAESPMMAGDRRTGSRRWLIASSGRDVSWEGTLLHMWQGRHKGWSLTHRRALETDALTEYLQKAIFSVSVFVVMSWKKSTTLVKRLCVVGWARTSLAVGRSFREEGEDETVNEEKVNNNYIPIEAHSLYFHRHFLSDSVLYLAFIYKESSCI